MSNARSKADPADQTTPDQLAPRRLPVQRRAADRVQRILDAAKAILAESGYEAATTKEIAARAHVAVGSLYQFFAGKDEIIAGVAAGYIDEMVDLVADVAATAPADPRSAIEALNAAYADFYRREPAFRTLWIEHNLDTTLSAADRELNTAIAANVRALINPLLERGLPLVDYEIAIEIGDALLDMAFARNPDGDQRIIAASALAIHAYLLAAGAEQ